MSDSEVESLRAKIDKIYEVLVGDEAVGTRGVIPRLKEVEKQQSQFDRKLTYAGGFLAGLVVVWEIARKKIGF